MNIGQDVSEQGQFGGYRTEYGPIAAELSLHIVNFPQRGHDPVMRGRETKATQTGAAPMSILAQTILADITFFEVAISVLGVGLIERMMYRLPVEMVGPGGWLLDTGASE